MIKIYGPAGSSAGRCYWMLEEIGVPYEAAEFSFRNRDNKTPEFLKLNPNGKVPVLIDGDTVLFESVAINSYLAEKYKPELLGGSIEDRAHVAKWGLWSQLEIQKPLVALFIQKVFVPEEKRDEAVMAKALEDVAPLNAILDAHLADKTFMVGDSFTLADLNMASVARINGALGISLEEYPHLDAWLSRTLDRPAQHRVDALTKG